MVLHLFFVQAINSLKNVDSTALLQFLHPILNMLLHLIGNGGETLQVFKKSIHLPVSDISWFLQILVPFFIISINPFCLPYSKFVIIFVFAQVAAFRAMVNILTRYTFQISIVLLQSNFISSEIGFLKIWKYLGCGCLLSFVHFSSYFKAFYSSKAMLISMFNNKVYFCRVQQESVDEAERNVFLVNYVDYAFDDFGGRQPPVYPGLSTVWGSLARSKVMFAHDKTNLQGFTLEMQFKKLLLIHAVWITEWISLVSISSFF